MRNFYNLLTTIVLLLLVMNPRVTAQWSNDPNNNLQICDTTGEQALAKMAMTSDAGCYISWFDTRSGEYSVYLQRLDPSGNKMWASNGLLISDHTQDTWITNYDLICDQNDNAVLVFSDIRTGSLKPVAYKISPNGDFLWGPDGIDISTPDDFQPTPTVAQMSDGNYVFAWISIQNNSAIALQKLSEDGQKLWSSQPILIQSATENLSYPAVVRSDAGAAIIIYTAATTIYSTKINAQKFDVNGQLLWGSPGISIQSNGQMRSTQVPFVSPDGNNGAFVAWTDGRAGNMLSSSFVQRISSDGNLYYPADGVEGSLNSTENKLYPHIAFDESTQETYMFWVETDFYQFQNGIYGQKFSLSGDRLWGDNGMVFVPLSLPNTTILSDLCSYQGDDMTFIFYFESSESSTNTKLMGFSLDTDGNFLWPGNFVTLANPTEGKMQLTSAVDIYKNCKFAWGDQRLDASGIYAQDINPLGQLGEPATPVELTSFTADVNSSNVVLNWKTATEINNKGFEIERKAGVMTVGNWEAIGFVGGYRNNNRTEGIFIYR